MLRQALEVGLSDPDATVPARLRRYIGFTRVNDQVLRDVRRTLDDDDGFRTRVRDAIGASGGAAVVGDAGWLLLDRPDGWSDELASLLAAADADAAAAEAERTERRAARQLERVSAALAESESAREAVAADSARVRDELASALAALAQVEARLSALSADRDDAVRKLKAAEERAAERARRVRELEQALSEAADGAVAPAAGAPAEDIGTATTTTPDPAPPAAPSGPPPGPPSVDAGADVDVEVDPDLDGGGTAPGPAAALATAWVDGAAARSALVDAGRAAAALSAALAELASLLPGTDAGADGDPGSAVDDERAGDPRGPRRQGRRRRSRGVTGRRPLPVPIGTFDDSPAAAEHLLRHPGVVVLVDGWNVSMAGWPDLDKALQRTRLVAALRALETRTGARITVVFDSSLDERSLPAASPVRSVQVRFAAAGTTADDEILAAIDALPREQPVVVVTADREVAAGAGARGANVVPTAALLAVL